jgi:hypothetical protein
MGATVGVAWLDLTSFGQDVWFSFVGAAGSGQVARAPGGCRP